MVNFYPFKSIFLAKLKSSWSKLMSIIRDLIDRNPFHGDKLKDKDRQILKDRFSVCLLI